MITIWNSVSDGVLLLDSKLRIIYANKQVKKILKNIKKYQSIDKICPTISRTLSEVLDKKEVMNSSFKLDIEGTVFLSDIFVETDEDRDNSIIIILLKKIQNNYLEKIKELEIAKELFEQIFENSADGLGCMDSKGKVLKLNKAYEQLLGLNKEDFLGKPADLIRKRGYLPKLATNLVLKDQSIHTIDIKVKDKEILITGLPVFDKEGKLIRIIANIRDMTELKNLQEKVTSYIKLNEKHCLELAHFRDKELNNISIVAKSSKMREVLETAIKSAQVDSNVLICGESGTGKGVIAKIIHRSSPRSNDPFITISCAAIPENLLESELFGYERGAFTGATNSKMGLLDVAHEGTLFLDEISSIPLNIQVKLLRVIQDKEFLRLGGKKSIKVDFKLIAATNENLYDMVKKGEFREDLYYRLNVINIKIPPLRERTEDIIPLVEHFTTYFNKKLNSNLTISPEILKEIQNHNWTGNVRELENTIERMVVLGEDIFLKDQFNQLDIINAIDPLNGQTSLPQFISQIEKKIILQAYRKEGTTRKAAQVLGINQATIVRKLQKYRFIANKTST